ncbi:nucleotidyltransferase family protein [Pseudomonas sp. NPDC090202]|uniref:nucleotidyltransferase family protein n=1 Tax=unclassified Pseudomonas TaxID=196821 RepID=UPI003824C9EA
MHTEYAYEDQLKAIVASNPQVMGWLRDAQQLNLNEWCIGAGLIRNLVWDTLQGNSFQPPDDIDLIYFESLNKTKDRQAELAEKISRLSPNIKWDVTNQATVHLWYCNDLGQEFPPLNSILEGISTWPEYCTAVAVHLDSNDHLSILAPYGLDDLFNFKVRWNSKRASFNDFSNRARDKFNTIRWPKLILANI